MKKIYIVYRNYYDFLEKKVTLGGVQTYINDLVHVCNDLKMEVHIVQLGDQELAEQTSDAKIEQYKVFGKNQNELLGQKLADVLTKEDVVLFATDYLIPMKTSFEKAIVIQHGITWDIPLDAKRGFLKAFLSKSKDAYTMINRLRRISKVVCVDYNFVNWYRTQVDRPFNELIVVPNYTRIAPFCPKPADRVNIIFARRFFQYRGTRVFTCAIKKILKERSNVFVTVAGSGPDEDWMRNELKEVDNVQFTCYESKDSLNIHADKHIAVVPTVGSEGTSLSLLEAMSAQCAVVASDVGGMTNIILDGYNGLLVPAGDVEKLYGALRRLIDAPEMTQQLASKGYEIVKSAFSHEKWAEKWKDILENVVR